MTLDPRPVVAHASKFPPSLSGVALYAATFGEALGRHAEMHRVVLPSDPAQTQRLHTSARWFVRGLRWQHPASVLHVELSGRALAEFYFTLGVLLRRDRPHVAVTCHDAPSIVGESMMFSALDRRGLRRIGEWLGRVVGRRVEATVLRRCTSVFALTGEGAAGLQRSWDREVHALGLVLVDRRQVTRPKGPLIYVPGPVPDNDPRLMELTRVVAAAEPVGGVAWRVVVGGRDDPARLAAVAARLSAGERSLLEFSGLVEESRLIETYAQAAVVVRLVGVGTAANSLAASSPLSLAIAAGCVCITDDTRAGARELAVLGLVEVTDDPVAALRRLIHTSRAELPATDAGVAYSAFGPDVVAERYLGFLTRDREPGAQAASP